MASSLSDNSPASTMSGSLAAMIRRHGAVLAIFAFAFAIRAPMFGNPILDVDEQLYLLMGDRLLHGHLPYVELWDRKPIGLFLVYAGVRLLGGTGIIQYQVVATLCAAATAALIRAMARRRAGPVASLAVALVYLHMLNAFGGMGGQACVIYGAITAAGAWAAYRAAETAERRRIVRLGYWAMLAFGIAIQFKYTPVVEGIFFGAFFVWRLWRVGQPPASLIAVACTMIGIALLPSLAATGFYAATGHLGAFVQANILSIFHRLPFPSAVRGSQWFIVLVMGGPLLVVAAIGMIRNGRERIDRSPALLLLMLGWPLAALAGFAMLGDFFSYYFISALPPLLILAATAIRPGLPGFVTGGLLLAWPVLMPPNYWHSRSDRIAIDGLVATVRPFVRDRCLYVYEGPVIAYLLADACAPTRFVFPDHLTNPIEAPAIGVDPAREEARLLATRPGVIITATSQVVRRVNPAPQALVKAALARDYVLIQRVPTSEQTVYVWALRALLPAPPSDRRTSPRS